MSNSKSMTLLDQALRLGYEELALLNEGDVEAAGLRASDRLKLTLDAKNASDKGDMTALRDKLLQLQALQGQLTTEARKLHAETRDALQQARQQRKRLAGYGKAARITPSFRVSLSKRG